MFFSFMKLEVSLSQTLKQLKDAISLSSLGPIETKHQRLFHLGRELKNGGRTLSTLGLGRYHNFVLHLHSTKPKTFDLYDGEDDEDVVEVVHKNTAESRERASSVVELLGSDDEAEPARKTVKRRRIS
jgi:hypothetical protein